MNTAFHLTQDGTADSLEGLLREGYVILRHAASDTLIETISRQLDPWFAQTPHCEGDFHGWQTTRIAAALFKAPATQTLLQHPVILSLMDAILAPHCDWYQLNLAQAIRLHPGERQQYPHRDDDMWPCLKSHEYMINVMWALEDFTPENGATLVWPRTAPTTIRQPPDVGTAVAAYMPRGSALVYLGSTLHCAGANRTGTPRTGLVLSYCLGWLKTYENSFLAYPPDIARTFSEPVRDLLGYRMHRPNLGSCEGQDPAIALKPHSRTLATVDALPPAIAQALSQHYASSL